MKTADKWLIVALMLGYPIALAVGVTAQSRPKLVLTNPEVAPVTSYDVEAVHFYLPTTPDGLYQVEVTLQSNRGSVPPVRYVGPAAEAFIQALLPTPERRILTRLIADGKLAAGAIR